MFFSATLEGVAGDLAGRYTADATTHEHGVPGRYDAARVEHRFVPVPDGDRLEALVKELGGGAGQSYRVRAHQARRGSAS